MLKIENVVLPSPEQWEAVIRGMRNPKNSWALSDSYTTHMESANTGETTDYAHFVGKKDHKLMTDLAKGGPVHAKYRRMIPVYLDITAPLYWWKEFDTYKVGTVCNSCSTMHKIQVKEFTLDDFSWEHIFDATNCPHDGFLHFDAEGHEDEPIVLFNIIIDALNHYRKRYLETKDKRYWWQMIQLLPSSYNQKRTIMLNYEVLVGIYKWRRDHKLDEWHVFCDWIEQLPYSELITGEDA